MSHTVNVYMGESSPATLLDAQPPDQRLPEPEDTLVNQQQHQDSGVPSPVDLPSSDNTASAPTPEGASFTGEGSASEDPPSPMMYEMQASQSPDGAVPQPDGASPANASDGLPEPEDFDSTPVKKAAKNKPPSPSNRKTK